MEQLHHASDASASAAGALTYQPAVNRRAATWLGHPATIGALLWWIGLATEYPLDLFPPGEGALYQLNQAIFLSGMIAWVVALVGWRRNRTAGSGRTARWGLALWAAGLGMLVIAGLIMNLITGSDENPMFPIGALTMTIGGILVAVAVSVPKGLSGRVRGGFAQLGFSFLVLLMLAPPILLGRNEPTWWMEAGWGASWLVAGLLLPRSATRPTDR